jgi:hypothetical protein
MKIECIEVEQLADIVAGLVRNGLTFRAYPMGAFWCIQLTGGY